MRKIIRAASVIVALGVAGVAGLLLLLWSEHDHELTLPAPSGSLAVGRVTDFWVDDQHVDALTGKRRELVMWIWYPGAPAPGAKRSDYVPANWRDALTKHRGFLLGTLLSRDPAVVHPNSFVNADVSTTQPDYPVVILRGGLAALITDYTTLAEDLASHGYVVVGFDAPHRTAIVVLPDGQVVTRPPEQDVEGLVSPAREAMAEKLLAAWTADVKFVVDRLEQIDASGEGPFRGRLNMHALGVAGHSLGGATAAQFCHDDGRCRAGIDIDGLLLGNVAQEGLHQPFMFLMSDHASEQDPESVAIRSTIQSVYDRLPADGRSQVTIPGANHFTFSDQMLTRSPTVMKLLQLAGVLRLEPLRGLAITTTYVHTFFDAHLKNNGGP